MQRQDVLVSVVHDAQAEHHQCGCDARGRLNQAGQRGDQGRGITNQAGSVFNDALLCQARGVGGQPLKVAAHGAIHQDENTDGKCCHAEQDA